jgi:hypothetical protein
MFYFLFSALVPDTGIVGGGSFAAASPRALYERAPANTSAGLSRGKGHEAHCNKKTATMDISKPRNWAHPQ